MLARHRFEFGDVERGQNLAQRQHAGRLRFTAGTGRRLNGVAGVEQHRAALLHVGVELVDGVLRWLRRAGDHRPVHQREEGEFIARRIDTDRLAGFQRGALREKQRQARQAGLHDRIDIGVAGQDIGETRLRNSLDGEVVIGGAARRFRGLALGWSLRGLRIGGRGHAVHGRQSKCDGERRRRGAASQQGSEPAAENGDDDGVDQEQRQRGGQQDAAQVARLGVGVGRAACLQCRRVERRKPVGGGQRIHRERTVGRPIKTGWMIERGAVAVVRAHRLCGGGGRAERAEAVKGADRRNSLCSGLGGDTRAWIGRVARHIDDSPQHLDEGARQRQVRPAHIGADMEQGDHTPVAMFAGHQRRAVGERGPASRGQRRIGFGQHLARDRNILRHGEARERTVGRERRQRLRLLPCQAAPQAAPAAPQFHRHQIVVACCQPRPGEAHQHAALRNPRVEAVADFRRQRADVGKHDHRQLLVEKLSDRHRRRAALTKPDVGERRQRAGEIEGRGQQRLCGVAGCAGDDADGAPPPALVEQLHRAGRAFAGDFEARDVVAQFHRQVEVRLGLAILRTERKLRFADRRTFLVQRADKSGIASAAVGAQHLHRHFRRGVLGSDQRMRGGSAAFENRQRAILNRLRQAFGEFAAASGVDAVAEPDNLAVTGLGEKARQRRQRLDSLDGIGLRRELAQRHTRGAGRDQRDVAGGVRQRHKRHRAPVGFRIGHQFVRGSDASLPIGRGAPAVVEQQHQRRAGARHAFARIPCRSCGREDHERGGEQAQQCQPPRRARRCFFLRRDIEQQARRRKIDAARARWHYAQQPPQRRQA